MTEPRFEVAILAGGEGTRLKARTGTLPKPMVPVGGLPALEHQVRLCRQHGFTRILFLVHYGHDVIRGHFGDGSAFGVSIGYQVESEPRGTAGALRDAAPRLSDTCLVLFGDTYVDVDLRGLWNAHLAHAADATLFVHPTDHLDDSDLIDLDATGRVTTLHPYPHPEGGDHRNLANAGLTVLQRDVLESGVPEAGRTDLIKDTVPRLLRAGRRVYGYVSPEYIKDIGTPERLDRVERDLAAGVPERLSGRRLRQAVFLDRDGTVNREVHHLSDPDQVDLLPGSAGAVRRLNRSGWLTAVVTNQPVVARGAVTFEGLERIHGRLERLLGREGAYLDAVYACPHHPDRGFPGEVPELKIACECRKPGTALIDRACRRFLIDRATSWLVGDKTCDIEAGRRAGLRTILVRTGYAGQDGQFPCQPDYTAEDLAGAVDWILDRHDRQ